MISLRSKSVRPRLCVAIGVAALTSLSTAALAKPAAAEDPVSRICRTTLGVQPGTSQHDSCVASLSGSLDSLSDNGAILSARNICLDGGLKERTAALAECTLKGETGAAAKVKAADLQPSATQATSYVYASNRERMGREQLACARIGLNPRLGAFDGCVAGLRAALFAADNPSN